MDSPVKFRDRAALVVSIIILGFFGYFEWWALGHSTDGQIVLGLMTALTNLVVFVAGYWVGSSKNSVSQAPKEPDAGLDVSKNVSNAVRVVALVAVLAAGALLMIGGQPAHAAPNCGWPHPDPECRAADIKDPPKTPDQFDTFKKLLIEDLTWARDDAANRTPPDTRHGDCWVAGLAWMTGPKAPVFKPPHIGIASAIQISFDLSGGIGQFVPEEVIKGCAATAFDLRLELMALLARLGVSPLLPKPL